MDTYSSAIKFCPNKKRFVATRFLHKSTKPLNLLQLIPFQLPLEDLHNVLRPKLGERVQAVEEEAFQLRLLVNLKPGAEILASTAFSFNLPSVVVMETTSSTFAKYLLNNPISHLGKYLQQTYNLQQVCDALHSAHKHESVLRLRVTSREINLIRRMWPFLWTNWKSVVLWTHQREHHYRHPPIRNIVVPFSMEVERMLSKCQFSDSEKVKMLALRDLAVRVHLLFQSIDAPHTRKMSLKRLAKAIEHDANTCSALSLISRVCGLSKLKKLSEAALLETGLIINRLTQAMSFEEYIGMRTTTSFTFSEEEVTLTKRTSESVWRILKQVEAFGLITCEEIKNSTRRKLSPMLPSCLRETLSALFTHGDMECMDIFKAFSNNDQNREQILAYMRHISKSSAWRDLQGTSDVQVSSFFEFAQEPYQESCGQHFQKLHLEKLTDGQAHRSARETLNTHAVIKVAENESIGKMAYDEKEYELTLGDTQRLNTNVASSNQVFINGACNKIKATNKTNSIDCKSVCSICGKEFTRKIGLTNHIRMHKKDASVTHSCNVCAKSFSNKSNLKRHMKTHGEATGYECLFCKVILTRQDQLCIHLAKHTKENSYMCEFCSAEFSEHKMLQRHSMSHNSGYLECTKCKNRFKTKQQLLQHKKSVHKVPTPHYCTFCLKGLQKYENLENHMRVHTNEKPFQCRSCQKDFNASTLALRHEKKYCN